MRNGTALTERPKQLAETVSAPPWCSNLSFALIEMESNPPPATGAEDFSRYLQGFGVGSDGAQRKNSPQIMSPLAPPVAAPPTGETRFKRKNRHVKTSSQPVKIDTAELRREYQKAQEGAQLVRQGSGEQESARKSPPLPVPTQAPVRLEQANGGEADKSTLSLNSTATIPGDELEGSEGAASTIKKRASHISFAKRLPKMSLMRSATSGGSSNASGSPRPRSPSKDSSITAFLRLGSRSALVSKLGLTSSSTSSGANQPSAKQESELSDTNTANGEEDEFRASPVLGATPTAATAAKSNAASRRSSAPISNLPANVVGTNDTAVPVIELAPRPTLMIEVPRERTPVLSTDLSPVLLQEKTASASNPGSLGLDTPIAANTVQAQAAQQQRIEQEKARFKREYPALDLHMAKSVLGASVIAKTAPSLTTAARTKRGSGGEIGPGSNVEEAMRLATLTLVANNEKRLRELSEKVTEFEKRASQIAVHANQVRDTLLDKCKELVQHAERVKGGIDVERESLRQKEIEYAKKNQERENELAWLDEKVSNALVSKEKVFRDRLNEAEHKLTSLAQGNFGDAESSWFINLLDHAMHTFMELVLLGGGTILSLISSIVVLFRTILPCFQRQHRPGSRSGTRRQGGRDA